MIGVSKNHSKSNINTFPDFFLLPKDNVLVGCSSQWFHLFVFDPIYKGKRAKISPKIHKIEILPKLRPKVINSPNQSHRDHIWGMFEL